MMLKQLLPELPRLYRRAIPRWYRALPARGLAMQELTAVFAIIDPSDPSLSDTLQRQDTRLQEEYESATMAGQSSIPSYSVPGLHSFRFTLIAPTEKTVGDVPPKAPALLLMSLVFDGDQRDVLTGLYEKMLPDLRAVLQHVHGFAGTSTVDQFVKFVLERRVRGGFFFRDVGVLDGGDPLNLDLTRTEVEQALSLRSEFVNFYAKHRGAEPESLKDAFDDWCREHRVGLQLPLSKLERAIPDEHRWIRRVVELTLRLQERNERRDSEHRKRRVAHTKHHGFMTATFQVEDILDERYAKGLFAKPGTFAAVLRTSNTSDTRGSDSNRDGRGLSIKVLDVAREKDAVVQPQPEKIAPPRDDDELGVAQSSPGMISQDFLLIANPTFCCRDVRDFTMLRSLLDVTVPAPWLSALALIVAHPRRLGILWQIYRRLDHVFEATYHSMTAYSLGDDTAVKYIVKARDHERFAEFRAPKGTENPLSVTLQESLTREPIVLDFFVHAPPPERVDVEDPTVDWDREAYEPVRVATLTIPPQDPTTAERLEQGERTTFNPWNALKEHRPLGSLNRARYAIYRASAEARRTRPGDQPTAKPSPSVMNTRHTPPPSVPPTVPPESDPGSETPSLPPPPTERPTVN